MNESNRGTWEAVRNGMALVSLNLGIAMGAAAEAEQKMAEAREGLEGLSEKVRETLRGLHMGMEGEGRS